ncbi:uncharacterized protein LOC144618525 [Crassostrea virginica]
MAGIMTLLWLCCMAALGPSLVRGCQSDSECADGYHCCTGTIWCCPSGYMCTGSSSCISVGVIVGPIVVLVIIIILVALYCYRRRRAAAS